MCCIKVDWKYMSGLLWVWLTFGDSVQFSWFFQPNRRPKVRWGCWNDVLCAAADRCSKIVNVLPLTSLNGTKICYKNIVDLLLIPPSVFYLIFDQVVWDKEFAPVKKMSPYLQIIIYHGWNPEVINASSPRESCYFFDISSVQCVVC